ncbi:MAG: FAD-dependent oxidoreductase [Actinobacteria bacterium]|nr:FAD-dependent oxidoreductase [Actinomycetota bacterium]
MPQRILVVGAGPAGLAAAWRAAAGGHEVAVVERAEVVGGMAGSFEVAGVRVDHGSHRLHPSTPPEVLGALRGLLGDDLQDRPRHGRIRLTGRWVGFPLRTADLLSRLPPGFAVRAAADALTGPLRRPRQAPGSHGARPRDTFAEVVRCGLGPAVAEEFYGPYVRKLWGMDPEALAGDLARRRVSAASAGAVARRLVRARQPAGRTFLYPRGGFGRISEALAEAAEGAGVSIRLGCGLTSVISASGPDGPVLSVRLDDGTSIEADLLWSTIPLPELARRVDPAPPATLLAAAGRLEHRALALVYLVLDQPWWTEFDAHYFPALDNPVARLSEPKRYRDDPADPTDRTVLCAEVPCDVGDAVWSAPAADLGALVADALARDDLPPVRAAQVEVRRLPRVYPRYRPGFAWDLARLELWLADQRGIVSFGRQGLFVPDNTHHALAMGWAAAACLADDHWDALAWRTARDGFRTHVVED